MPYTGRAGQARVVAVGQEVPQPVDQGLQFGVGFHVLSRFELMVGGFVRFVEGKASRLR